MEETKCPRINGLCRETRFYGTLAALHGRISKYFFADVCEIEVDFACPLHITVFTF